MALDIGSENVRLLQLVPSSGTAARGVAGALWTCPPEIAHDETARRQSVIEAVKGLVSGGKFKGRQVVTALPADVVNIKNVRLPEMPPERLHEALQAEARERFPFPINSDHQLNYLMAGQIRTGKEVRNEIILFAAMEDDIEQHVQLLTDMDLEPTHLEAEPVAAFRSAARWMRRESDEDTITVVVDIGVRGAWVVVGRGPRIVFVKFVEIGGKNLTQGVCRQLGLDYEEAHRIRRQAGDMMIDGGEVPPDGPVPNVEAIRNAIRSDVESLCGEIALCLRYCSVTFRGMQPEGIRLAGGESRNALTVAMIAEHLGMECVAEDPFRNVDMSTVGIDDRRGAPSDWSLCAGMAFRGADWADAEQEGPHGER